VIFLKATSISKESLPFQDTLTFLADFR